MGTCLFCEKSFETKATGRPRKFCSENCRGKYKHQKTYSPVKIHKEVTLICEACNKPFQAKKSNTKYCSRKCFYQIKKEDWKKEYTCKWCDNKFKSNNKGVKFCSSKCVGEFQRIEAIERAKQTMPRNHFRSRRARTEYLRRKRIRDNFVEHVDINVLIERDECICQLCKEPVLLEAHYLHDLAPTKDHIIALSNGGEHSYANSQLAHRICNNVKNNHKHIGGEDIVKTKQKREGVAP